MKEKDGYVDYKQHQVIMYVEKDDDSYGPLKTGSYISEKYFDDFLLKRRNLEESMINKLKEGEISPVYMYMTLAEISLAELAARVKLSKSRVKKHLDPKYFEKIKLSHLKLYAEIFDIPVSNFFQYIVFNEDNTLKSYSYEKWRRHRDQSNNEHNIRIEQIETNSPYLVITKIEENQK